MVYQKLSKMNKSPGRLNIRARVSNVSKILLILSLCCYYTLAAWGILACCTESSLLLTSTLRHVFQETHWGPRPDFSKPEAGAVHKTLRVRFRAESNRFGIEALAIILFQVLASYCIKQARSKRPGAEIHSSCRWAPAATWAAECDCMFDALSFRWPFRANDDLFWFCQLEPQSYSTCHYQGHLAVQVFLFKVLAWMAFVLTLRNPSESFQQA